MRRLIAVLLTVSLIALLLIGCENQIGNTTKSSNADLSGLIVSAGTLSPTFSAGTTAYSISVPNATSIITITGSKADSNATLSSNNGFAQGVNVGTNTITITVTAQDGVTKKDYIVTVIRDNSLVGTWVLKADSFVPPGNAYIFANDNSFIYKATSTTDSVTTFYQTKGTYTFENNILTMNHSFIRSITPNNFIDDSGWSTTNKIEIFYYPRLYNGMLFKWASKSESIHSGLVGTWTSRFDESVTVKRKEQYIFNSDLSGTINLWNNTTGDFTGAPNSVKNITYTSTASTFTITILPSGPSYTIAYLIDGDYLLNCGSPSDFDLASYVKQ